MLDSKLQLREDRSKIAKNEIERLGFNISEKGETPQWENKDVRKNETKHPERFEILPRRSETTDKIYNRISEINRTDQRLVKKGRGLGVEQNTTLTSIRFKRVFELS